MKKAENEEIKLKNLKEEYENSKNNNTGNVNILFNYSGNFAK